MEASSSQGGPRKRGQTALWGKMGGGGGRKRPSVNRIAKTPRKGGVVHNSKRGAKACSGEGGAQQG